jgi:hypothetical protein
MEKIYSRTETPILLAIIVRIEDFNKPRNEIVPETEFIQGAAICVFPGDKFRPHKHILKPLNSHYGFNNIIAQECWIVLHGKIVVTLFDLDDSPHSDYILNNGDSVFLLRGGHTFRCIETASFIYELKAGPYEGQAKDKIFINE